MNNILAYVLYFVFLLLYLFGGTLFIESAIHSFIRKQYFTFGLNTMMVIYFTICLVRHMIGGL